jgi:type VI secretion system protein ImpK
VDLFSLILSLQKANDLDEARTLYRKVEEQLKEMEERAKESNIDKSELEAAKFALVAFIDEIVMSSKWTDRLKWPSLQYHYFKTNRAGDEFFKKLEAIRNNGYDPEIWRAPSKSDVLEVYYLCLMLGFKGKLGFASPEKYQHEINQIRKHIQSKALGRLSPSLAPKKFIHLVSRRWPWWAWITIGVYAIVIAMMAFIFTFIFKVS